MKARPMKMLTVAMLAACSLATGVAEAAGVLTIGRREDGTTFDPI